MATPASPAPGQTVLELRASTTEYRFVDLSHTFRNRFVLDVLYLGVPGMNELYVGAGYQIRPAPGVSLADPVRRVREGERRAGSVPGRAPRARPGGLEGGGLRGALLPDARGRLLLLLSPPSEASRLLPFATVVGLAYFVLALRFWFYGPVLGTGLGVLCFLAAWLLQ